MSNIDRHFEDTWNASERLAIKKHKDASATLIIDKIKTLLGSYEALNTFAESADIRKTLKKKYMGEVLFLLSALSHRDEMNIWAALVEEMALNKTE